MRLICIDPLSAVITNQEPGFVAAPFEYAEGTSKISPRNSGLQGVRSVPDVFQRGIIAAACLSRGTTENANSRGQPALSNSAGTMETM
jgi:hypothetical protein